MHLLHRIALGLLSLLPSLSGNATPLAKVQAMNIHGMLERQFSLGYTAATSPAGFELQLRHSLRVGYLGSASSRWSVPNLMSYCIARADGIVEWCSPSGTTVLFRNGRARDSESGQEVDDLGVACIGPDRYEVTNGEGVTFSYRNNSIDSIRWSKTLLTVHSDGVWIKAVMDPSGAPILKARYNQDGDLIELKLGGELFVFTYAGGQLQTFAKNSLRIAQFEYRDGLVSRIVEGSKTDEFVWTKLDQPRDARLWQSPYPVVLKEDTAFRYSCMRNSSETRLIAERKSDGRQCSLTYHQFSRTFTEIDLEGNRVKF